MATYSVNKGIGKNWQFRGISPFFCFAAIICLAILAFFFLILFMAAGIEKAAYTLPFVALVIYAAIKLNRRFGNDGIWRWIASTKGKKKIISKAPNYKKILSRIETKK